MHRYKPETEALRQLIDASGLTHAEIAQRIGIDLTENQVSNLATGRKALTVETLLTLLEIFEVPLEDYADLLRNSKKRQGKANSEMAEAASTTEPEPIDQALDIHRSVSSIAGQVAQLVHNLRKRSG